MKTYPFKADDAEMAAWKAAAQAAGLSFARWLRDAATAACENERAGVNGPSGRKAATPPATRKGAGAARSSSCENEHFHRAGTFCKRCGTTPEKDRA